MKGSGRGWLAVVLVLGVVSLGGLAPVRSLEQIAASATGVLDGLLGEWLPDESVLVDAAAVERARAAYATYRATVLGTVSAPGARSARDAGDPPRAPLLVPVVEHRPARHEIAIDVPRDTVAEGAAATHRDVLLGFVHRVQGDRATVALLGHSAARPVAGEWASSPTARPVWFLLDGQQGELTLHSRSSSVMPIPGQLAWTRDVTRLGDDLAPGLLLGRVLADVVDEPGGAVIAPTDAVRLAPVLDPHTLGLVCVEAAAGAARETRTRHARLVLTSRGDRRWRLDAGAAVGVEPGDWVVQDGVFVGVVEVVGRGSSEVAVRPPPGLLLVLDDGLGAGAPEDAPDAPDAAGDGAGARDPAAGGARAAGAAVSDDFEVVPCTLEAGGWPEGWRPRRGALVASGQLGYGGVLLGAVGVVHETRFELARQPIDPRRAVTIVEP